MASRITIQRKLDRNPLRLAWDSSRKGTYVFAKHGELK